MARHPAISWVLISCARISDSNLLTNQAPPALLTAGNPGMPEAYCAACSLRPTYRPTKVWEQSTAVSTFCYRISENVSPSWVQAQHCGPEESGNGTFDERVTEPIHQRNGPTDAVCCLLYGNVGLTINYVAPVLEPKGPGKFHEQYPDVFRA